MRKALSPYIATRTMDYGTGRWAPVIEELSGRGGYVIHKARPELLGYRSSGPSDGSAALLALRGLSGTFCSSCFGPKTSALSSERR